MAQLASIGGQVPCCTRTGQSGKVGQQQLYAKQYKAMAPSSQQNSKSPRIWVWSNKTSPLPTRSASSTRTSPWQRRVVWATRITCRGEGSSDSVSLTPFSFSLLLTKVLAPFHSNSQSKPFFLRNSQSQSLRLTLPLHVLYYYLCCCSSRWISPRLLALVANCGNALNTYLRRRSTLQSSPWSAIGCRSRLTHVTEKA